MLTCFHDGYQVHVDTPIVTVDHLFYPSWWLRATTSAVAPAGRKPGDATEVLGAVHPATAAARVAPRDQLYDFALALVGCATLGLASFGAGYYTKARRGGASGGAGGWRGKYQTLPSVTLPASGCAVNAVAAPPSKTAYATL